jgi:hypothetical protein
MTTKITEQNISELANAGVNWQSVFTGDGSTGLTTVAGRGYFIDTTSGTVTVTLPASPSVGDVVVLKDYARTWNTNNVVIDTNLLDGNSNAQHTFSAQGATVKLVFMDATKGWSLINEDTTTELKIPPTFTAATGGTVTESGDFKIHTFTGDGCFVVSSIGNATATPGGGPAVVDYLVVAGGGGGGVNGGYASYPRGTGGGGAGGFRYSASGWCSPSPAPGHPLRSPTGITVTAQTYPITVGGGGTGRSAPTNPDQGGAGSNSVFSTITSAGGAGGGGHCQGTSVPELSGGSGAGGRNGVLTGGSGNTPPVSPPQGNDGGDASGGDITTNFTGAGGGGAGAAGGNGTSPAGAVGGVGAGIPNVFGTIGEPSGGFYYYAGGGAAGNGYNGPVGAGGTGGGGPGGAHPGSSAGSAPANRGGGGGGTGGQAAGSSSSGGKGLVVLRYKYQ